MDRFEEGLMILFIIGIVIITIADFNVFYCKLLQKKYICFEGCFIQNYHCTCVTYEYYNNYLKCREFLLNQRTIRPPCCDSDFYVINNTHGFRYGYGEFKYN